MGFEQAPHLACDPNRDVGSPKLPRGLAATCAEIAAHQSISARRTGGFLSPPGGAGVSGEERLRCKMKVSKQGGVRVFGESTHVRHSE